MATRSKTSFQCLSIGPAHSAATERKVVGAKVPLGWTQAPASCAAAPSTEEKRLNGLAQTRFL
jgi:hypothetical protein